MNQEYLIVNNLGGYSSLSVGANPTRKYHGLLVYSNENLERFMLLNRLIEEIDFGTGMQNISANYFGENQKIGEDFLVESVSTSYSQVQILLTNKQNPDLRVKKTIQIEEFANKLVVNYEFIGIQTKASVRLLPIIGYRNFHDLHHAENLPGIELHTEDNMAHIKYNNGPELSIYCPQNSDVAEFGEVYRNFSYPEESARGYYHKEDLLAPLEVHYMVTPEQNRISIEFEIVDESEKNTAFADNLRDTKVLQNVDLGSKDLNDFYKHVDIFSKSFLVATPNRTSVLAGYHWFEDWGRDTFISFKGLVLDHQLFDIADEILKDWKGSIKNGLIPNRIGLDEYNSVDATLWYVVAIYQYFDATGYEDISKEYYDTIKEIVFKLIEGTNFGIKVHPKVGFLLAGQEGSALTWMDAVYNGEAATPRIGAPVEIQFLWYNVLKIFTFFAKKQNDLMNYHLVSTIAKDLKYNFNKYFWLQDKNYLADYIDFDTKNKQIRPNPVIGLSLPFDLISKDKAIVVLSQVEYYLNTVLGLRTLSPMDTEFEPFYSGSQENRDNAYHQGTVWPWLWGFYLKSYLKAHDYSEDSKHFVKGLMLQFWSSLNAKHLSYIPEVFGALDLAPGGCVSQAWNYATIHEVFKLLES